MTGDLLGTVGTSGGGAAGVPAVIYPPPPISMPPSSNVNGGGGGQHRQTRHRWADVLQTSRAGDVDNGAGEADAAGESGDVFSHTVLHRPVGGVSVCVVFRRCRCRCNSVAC